MVARFSLAMPMLGYLVCSQVYPRHCPGIFCLTLFERLAHDIRTPIIVSGNHDTAQRSCRAHLTSSPAPSALLADGPGLFSMSFP